MMSVIIAILFLISSVCAQEAFTLLESAELAVASISKPINPKDQLTNCPIADLTESSINDEIVCVSENDDLNSEDYKTFLLSYDSIEQVPESFKKQLPGASLEGNTSGAVSIIVALPNDNKLFGMWGMMFGYEKDGDDYGYTHGSSVSIAKTGKNGMTTKLIGSSDVFTERIGSHPENLEEEDGTSHIAQHFTNETLLKVVVDNKAAGKLSYWKAGAGWHRLDSKNSKSMLLATGQQSRWHNLLREVSGPEAAMNPINVQDGKGVRDSFQVEAFMGLQKNFVFGNSSCRIKTYGEVGGQISPLGASYFKTEVGTYFFYQKPTSKFALMAGGKANATVFKGGKDFTFEPEIGVKQGRASLSLVYSQSYGQINNYQGYNKKYHPQMGDDTPKAVIEPMMSIKLGFVIGRVRKPKK